ncbi:hypothetical protein CP061683_0903B, partial [Chlamydia psittaci 06-1683]
LYQIIFSIRSYP